MKSKISKISSSVLVVILTLALLFNISADTVSTVSAASYIKELTSVDTNFEDFLDGSVVQKLPSTVKDDDIISIIVMLDKAPLIDTFDEKGGQKFSDYAVNSSEAEALRGEIADDKSAMLARLDELGIEYNTGANYSTILSGYELLITARDFDATCKALGEGATAIVGEVYNPADAKLVNNKVDVYEETGIFDSSDFKYNGEGMVVAVLDTGLDYTHDAFKADKLDGYRLGLTIDEVNAVLSGTNAKNFIPGLLAGDVYVSNKVPFAFDYSDVDSDVYSIHNNHGTHVSGVIAGDDDVITGVAPKAQIVSMKIFSDTMDTARTSWILAALEDAVTLGVDVINMSLGTACGFSRERDEELVSGVYENIKEKGISLVVAASNSYSSAFGSEKNGNLPLTSNPDSGTVGSPSTYPGAMSVASINGTKTSYILYEQADKETIIYFLEATNSASKEKNFCDELLTNLGVESAEIEYVLIPGIGRDSDYTDMNVEGKVVLVRRGTNTFEEKANAAQNAGAAGIIIYNNTSGDIRMNAGITNIPICSVSQVDGELLAAAKTGKIKISRSQASGPFMSDFSSWGPTPDLKIKPEITAHGGNILSAITGNRYDRLSGTSMACPNMAGVIALLRQYVIAEYPADEITLPGGEINYREVNAIINRLLMSTADVIYNKNGLPYAVRKQGAGLANLTASAATTAYILTYDKGTTEFTRENAMDKTKLELGDDPTKSGIYTLTFSVYNFGNSALSYDISTIVMTEGVSDTPTYKGDTVVTEQGYMLEAGSEITSVIGGGHSGSTVTVGAGETATVTVTVTLTEADKAYLDASFENGMYIEGFVQLEAKSGTTVDLGAPFLAFYGDWTKAPMFDTDYFETNADELNDSIELLDKTLPDAYATRPVGSVDDDYVSYLGSYYFIQNPEDKIIAASRDYIAISNYEGAVHSLEYVWAGLLRSAERIVITITDASTGEVVFERVENDVRKSYGDGGSIYPAGIDVEFDAAEHNLKNNTTYNVKLQGYLDYGDGGLVTNEKSTFEFPITTDFQAPAITDVEYYTEYDKDAKKTRLFAKIAVYDNHYAMALQVGYIGPAPEGSEYTSQFLTFSNYLTPVYSEKNSTTYVTYELTDYIFDIKNESINKNTFAIATYDYALNPAVYEIPLPNEYVNFYLEESSITLNPFEVYTLTPLVYPNTEWPELLTYTSSNEDVAKVINNKLVAVASGKATIFIYDPDNPDHEIKLTVNVRKEGDEGYKKVTQPVADEFAVIGYETLKAYYILDSAERDIGETGNIRSFTGAPSLSLFPSESVKLRIRLSEYFEDITEVRFISGNSKVLSVDENGVIIANEKGFANVTVQLYLAGKKTSYSKTVRVEVKDPYLRTGPILNNYYGNGGLVEIPENLLFTEIGQFAFSNYHYIPKEPHEIYDDDPSTTKIWYIGEHTITKVVIPEGVEKINQYAFANLTELREVVLPSTLKQIEYGAFYGCEKLQTITGLENVITINKQAFQGCDLRGEISLDSAHAVADYAFAENKNLKSVVISETLRSVGAYAFAMCEDLESVTVNAEKVKLGAYAFLGCSSLESIDINAGIIPAGAFMGCSSLTDVKLGKDVSAFGEYAFAGTHADFEIDENNSYFRASASGDAIISTKDGKDTLVLVSPDLKGSFTLEGVEYIGDGAFSGNSSLVSVNMPDAHTVGKNAFSDCVKLSSVTLAPLKSIGNYAFFNTPITALPALDDSLTEIGKYAFAYTDITSVTVPAGVTVLEGAFCECQALREVTVRDGAVLDMGAFMLGRDSVNPRTNKKNYDFVPATDNGKTIYRFKYTSALVSLTIGNGVVIGDSAFFGAASLIRATIGEGTVIGDKAFYNAQSLADINLENASEIGSMAFSGDVLYQFTDPYQQTPYYVSDKGYIYSYHSAALTSVRLANAARLGDSAFQYCKSLKTVALGESITEIPYMAFAECTNLSDINLEGVKIVGEAAFSYTALTSANLTAAVDIGPYAFLSVEPLTEITLGSDISSIGEGAFAYCKTLDKAVGLGYVEYIDAYAFAYTTLTEIDLTGAITIGDNAFMKVSPSDESFSGTIPFVSVILGENIVTLGDNPFANCKLEPFYEVITTEFGGKEYTEISYTFDISDTVKVIDGSLYCVVPAGLELTTYIGLGGKSFIVPEGTVRISALAFAASDIVRVTLPHTLNSIGHKAFFDCMSLETVVFKSYEAPILEEEFDQNYFFSGENFPDTGVYTNGTDNFNGLGIVPFIMYITIDAENNVFDYGAVYYGASFVDYVGHMNKRLVMVAPSNGKFYDSFMLSQYFGERIAGSVSADDTTLAAIEAIDAMPDKVLLEHESLVIAARTAYDKIASMEQRALVFNYPELISAETRIEAFKNTGSGSTPEPELPEGNEPTPEKKSYTVYFIIASLIIWAGGVAAIIILQKKSAPKAAPTAVESTVAKVTEESKDEENTDNE